MPKTFTLWPAGI